MSSGSGSSGSGSGSSTPASDKKKQKEEENLHKVIGDWTGPGRAGVAPPKNGIYLPPVILPAGGYCGGGQQSIFMACGGGGGGFGGGQCGPRMCCIPRPPCYFPPRPACMPNPNYNNCNFFVNSPCCPCPKKKEESESEHEETTRSITRIKSSAKIRIKKTQSYATTGTGGPATTMTNQGTNPLPIPKISTTGLTGSSGSGRSTFSSGGLNSRGSGKSGGSNGNSPGSGGSGGGGGRRGGPGDGNGNGGSPGNDRGGGGPGGGRGGGGPGDGRGGGGSGRGGGGSGGGGNSGGGGGPNGGGGTNGDRPHSHVNIIIRTKNDGNKDEDEVNNQTSSNASSVGKPKKKKSLKKSSSKSRKVKEKKSDEKSSKKTNKRSIDTPEVRYIQEIRKDRDDYSSKALSPAPSSPRTQSSKSKMYNEMENIEFSLADNWRKLCIDGSWKISKYRPPMHPLILPYTYLNPLIQNLSSSVGESPEVKHPISLLSYTKLPTMMSKLSVTIQTQTDIKKNVYVTTQDSRHSMISSSNENIIVGTKSISSGEALAIRQVEIREIKEKSDRHIEIQTQTETEVVELVKIERNEIETQTEISAYANLIDEIVEVDDDVSSKYFTETDDDVELELEDDDSCFFVMRTPKGNFENSSASGFIKLKSKRDGSRSQIYEEGKRYVVQKDKTYIVVYDENKNKSKTPIADSQSFNISWVDEVRMANEYEIKKRQKISPKIVHIMDSNKFEKDVRKIDRCQTPLSRITEFESESSYQSVNVESIGNKLSSGNFEMESINDEVETTLVTPYSISVTPQVKMNETKQLIKTNDLEKFLESTKTEKFSEPTKNEKLIFKEINDNYKNGSSLILPSTPSKKELRKKREPSTKLKNCDSEEGGKWKIFKRIPSFCLNRNFTIAHAFIERDFENSKHELNIETTDDLNSTGGNLNNFFNALRDMDFGRFYARDPRSSGQGGGGGGRNLKFNQTWETAGGSTARKEFRLDSARSDNSVQSLQIEAQAAPGTDLTIELTLLDDADEGGYGGGPSGGYDGNSGGFGGGRPGGMGGGNSPYRNPQREVGGGGGGGGVYPGASTGFYGGRDGDYGGLLAGSGFKPMNSIGCGPSQACRTMLIHGIPWNNQAPEPMKGACQGFQREQNCAYGGCNMCDYALAPCNEQCYKPRYTSICKPPGPHKSELPPKCCCSAKRRKKLPLLCTKCLNWHHQNDPFYYASKRFHPPQNQTIPLIKLRKKCKKKKFLCTPPQMYNCIVEPYPKPPFMNHNCGPPPKKRAPQAETETYDAEVSVTSLIEQETVTKRTSSRTRRLRGGSSRENTDDGITSDFENGRLKQRFMKRDVLNQWRQKTILIEPKSPVFSKSSGSSVEDFNTSDIICRSEDSSYEMTRSPVTSPTKKIFQDYKSPLSP